MSAAPARFTKIRNANGEHIITRDNQTGLEWAAQVIGDYTNELNNSEAEKACRELTLGGHDDWRLPTLDELLTLVDRSRYRPAIDTDAFPDCSTSGVWTSTQGACKETSAWFVNFYEGSCDTARRENAFRVRPVRDPNAAAAKAGV